MRQYEYRIARQAAVPILVREDRPFFSLFFQLGSFIFYFYSKLTISQNTNGILIHLQRRFL